jgi:hypothetical protein
VRSARGTAGRWRAPHRRWHEVLLLALAAPAPDALAAEPQVDGEVDGAVEGEYGGADRDLRFGGQEE